jgi:deoxyribodipyrimidine photolyase-related protein
MTSLLNNGLLSPTTVLQEALKAPGIPMNSKEGFIRQVLGWREYMRFIYQMVLHSSHHTYKLFKKGNNKNTRFPTSWYDGATGITPFDMEVKKVHTYAYAHHIIRLMVFLNLMKLANADPAAIYKWFMELVAIDAYDWVMVSNLAAMGHYGMPKFMHKPYVSSNKYILRMSDYKRGPWCDTWDKMYSGRSEWA